jgi:hypothetical protein
MTLPPEKNCASLISIGTLVCLFRSSTTATRETPSSTRYAILQAAKDWSARRRQLAHRARLCHCTLPQCRPLDCDVVAKRYTLFFANTFRVRLGAPWVSHSLMGRGNTTHALGICRGRIYRQCTSHFTAALRFGPARFERFLKAKGRVAMDAWRTRQRWRHHRHSPVDTAFDDARMLDSMEHRCPDDEGSYVARELIITVNNLYPAARKQRACQRRGTLKR